MDIKYNEETHPIIAESLPSKNIIKEAIQTYRASSKTNLRIEAGLAIASALEQAGKHLFRQKVLSALTIEFPNDHRPHLFLASYELGNKQHRAAWRHLQACLRINPSCADAWEKAYECATELDKHDICEQITYKLLELDPSSAKYHELLGKSLIQQNKPLEACEAYAEAYKHAPSDIVYFLNSKLPFCRISAAGRVPHHIASKIISTTSFVEQWLGSGRTWELRGDRGLSNSLFYTAYSPLNLRNVYEPYLSMLSYIVKPLIENAIEVSNEMAERLTASSSSWQNTYRQTQSEDHPKVRLGITSKNFYSHSNALAFEGMLKYLNKNLFTLVLIHGWGTRTDWMHMRLNDWADEVVYLSDSLPHTHMVLVSLDLDFLFFTDLGMDPFDFLLPAIRACKIQISGWGLPHTTGLKSIDYYLSSNLLESKEHAGEYTEDLVLLQGLPCCFLSENLQYQKQPKHYFMLPDDCVVIGCVQTLFKIHPDMDLLLERVAMRLPNAVFAFVTISEHLDRAFLDRLERRAPVASQRIVMLQRCSSTDYLALCDCLDIILDTPYYGAGVTAYMSAYVGTPMVCFSGSRLRDSTTASIYRYLSIPNAPIVNSIPEYVEKVVELAQNFDLRFQIKKDTVDAAHRLYDNQEYIRSFEEFCLNLLGRT